ncbi:hypothetical protein SAMN05192534_101356 [Alteribacillus persepolensis]|uniref:Uncharacterized protein n=1 Tax=Alteribacillus persepolensis TaxID=568899 RepID=A0A1G7Z0U9_9BACI|nr:hypothetical protein [Alteribacillus persepolensis]SDH02398.1 hypothetical protein SAMN05192534_101356 [Alteribacillus persepolensis]
MMKTLSFLKPKRSWHDYNTFERKIWVQLLNEKTSELRRRFGHSIECYRIAKRYADQQMKYLG